MTTVEGAKFAGPEWKQTGQKKAERILAEELERRGWQFQDPGRLRKAGPEKLKIAGRLRAETTVTFDWIARHLTVGAPGYVSNCLRIPKH